LVEVILDGQFTFADHNAFRRVIDEIADKSPKNCTIDLSQVSYLDSAAVGMLLLLRERLDEGKISLRGGSSSVKELIRIAKLATLFNIED
jgi:anti-anti-sigma factor